MHAQTLFAKIWDQHVVEPGDETRPDLLYVDLHLVHEVTSPQAFEGLRLASRPVRRPDLTLATVDHNVPTTHRDRPWADAFATLQVEALRQNCAAFGIPLLDVHDIRQGIVHVVGPEQGLTQPGMTIVCGDSHTATHGAFGAFAFGIGTSEVEHVLATQTLPRTRPKTMAVEIDGELAAWVSSKDVVLTLIARIGVGGATGHVIEYRSSLVRAMSMEARMTLCNMAIEAGARAGLVAPDDTTADYLRDRPFAPQGPAWDEATQAWRRLHSDPGATFDTVVELTAETIEPRVTWGTNPAQNIAISEPIPDPDALRQGRERDQAQRALDYMGLTPGTRLCDVPVDRVFIGSCTNARIEDLREAALVAYGHTVPKGVHAMVVPGSGLVKAQAEAEGLDEVFREAGFEWRDPGCSMCLGMNPDVLAAGQRCASTSNRNFEGRQGAGGRTHLCSPAMAAAAAVHGHFVDVREVV